MSYDTKCYELAKAFLTDVDTKEWATERHIDQLAQDIQDAIEGYIAVCTSEDAIAISHQPKSEPPHAFDPDPNLDCYACGEGMGHRAHRQHEDGVLLDVPRFLRKNDD